MMSDDTTMVIKREHGHSTLYVNGVFEGNYDTWSEAIDAYEELLKEREETKEAVSA